MAQMGHWKRTSNGIVESLLGEMASLVGSVENLIVEDGEVQRETEADLIGRGTSEATLEVSDKCPQSRMSSKMSGHGTTELECANGRGERTVGQRGR